MPRSTRCLNLIRNAQQMLLLVVARQPRTRRRTKKKKEEVERAVAPANEGDTPASEAFRGGGGILSVPTNRSILAMKLLSQLGRREAGFLDFCSRADQTVRDS